MVTGFVVILTVFFYIRKFGSSLARCVVMRALFQQQSAAAFNPVPPAVIESASSKRSRNPNKLRLRATRRRVCCTSHDTNRVDLRVGASAAAIAVTASRWQDWLSLH
ncbi:hypothetical protein HPB50_023658 [Hyalomma asiaticum]|uniref:Uncharacterized protein n=1 Tax=Hyalomma asiaticum TaxID=266040 RepID=A0ACB7T2V9_HYAAI|nr:hypothetical protein HPB50_023658 [Hyalomma asiaticum]